MEKTYYPIYVASYATQNYLLDDDYTSHEYYFADYFNAVHFARDIAKCEDVVGDIKILNSATGEVQIEIEASGAVRKSAPTEIEEEPDTDNVFIDKFGYTWKKQCEGRWSVNCTGINCRDCLYNQDAGDCKTDYLTLEEVCARITKAGKKDKGWE